MNISVLLILAALILFVLAAIGVASGRINLIAAGLACIAASMLVPLL